MTAVAPRPLGPSDPLRGEGSGRGVRKVPFPAAIRGGDGPSAGRSGPGRQEWGTDFGAIVQRRDRDWRTPPPLATGGGGHAAGRLAVPAGDDERPVRASGARSARFRRCSGGRGERRTPLRAARVGPGTRRPARGGGPDPVRATCGNVPRVGRRRPARAAARRRPSAPRPFVSGRRTLTSSSGAAPGGPGWAGRGQPGCSPPSRRAGMTTSPRRTTCSRTTMGTRQDRSSRCTRSRAANPARPRPVRRTHRNLVLLPVLLLVLLLVLPPSGLPPRISRRRTSTRRHRRKSRHVRGAEPRA